MKMKKVAIASITIGTMLTMAACSPSADKEAEKKEQVTAQNEGETKTTSTDEASKTTKDTEKETNTSSNEKTDKDAKNTKESSGTENNGKTTKEKETTGKTNEQTTSGKATDQTTSGKTTDQTTSGKTTKDPKKSVAVKTNVKEVVTLIESLDKQLAANPKLETVNKLGKQINEKWDVIEKELEASHPTDSKTIGQSMYPLIVGAEKEKIDITKMKSLTSKTKKDLNQLLTKLS
ncbi:MULTISPECIES: hypothetical protein [Bacillus]|uniref:Lipoprotein n=1 Tax=Bacillus toyonensis TaxID=155322 RepID=A0A2B5Z0L3_9BACI|nr:MULTISPECIES: hypothetical protein [Bacillus]EEL22089.1 hypothetical protein bcere0017_30830 [Bacillus cereus Rock1-3]EEL60043.1 hypothetical protein bcere0024_044380 [Bacillus cereus Rock4-18]EOP23802.1 lipoprotein [Bacillus cereus VD131]KNH40676.1 lipoprotein [Bacillus thuringiensis]KXY20259.1 hypothetical protein AT259_15105 [Bacillus cereus]MDH8706967.1 DNA primase catalytic subunit [Stenotrophomonas sp. 1198]OTX32949.1 hypothetical protein BK717_19415 [Bacillus thuringiensis serovar 